MAITRTESEAQHERECEAAGCLHPALYDFGGKLTWGWCKLCRAEAVKSGNWNAEEEEADAS